MDRRSLLTGVAASGGLLLVGTPAEAARPAPPVLEYGQEGGFVPAGWDALRAPTLVVYQDGNAIVEARYRWRLRDRERLVRHAVAVLRDPANGTLTLGPDDPQVADAPHTYVRARGHHLSVYALDIYREYGAYPAATYALRDALEEASALVRMRGERYRPDAVKLVAIALDGAAEPSGPIHPWPAGVAVPALTGDAWQAAEHRYGAAARAVVRALPGAPADWRVHRTPAGRLLSLSYRRLLPHEISGWPGGAA